MTLDAALEAFHSGNDALAQRLAIEALTASAVAPKVRVEALGMLSRVALRRCDLEDAARTAQEASDAAGTDRHLMQTPVHLLAAVARLRGDLPEAAARYRASIELNETLGIDGAVRVERRNLAYVELQLGHAHEAHRLFGIVHSDADPMGFTPCWIMPCLLRASATFRQRERRSLGWSAPSTTPGGYQTLTTPKRSHGCSRPSAVAGGILIDCLTLRRNRTPRATPGHMCTPNASDA